MVFLPDPLRYLNNGAKSASPDNKQNVLMMTKIEAFIIMNILTKTG